jgi:hypothetical protein
MVYDTIDSNMSIIKTKGISVQPRYDHCAAIYGLSMIVFGGQYQNGSVANDMLTFDLEFNEWTRINFKQLVEPMMQLTACTVLNQKKRLDETVLITDKIIDGIYFFGGKNAQG